MYKSVRQGKPFWKIYTPRNVYRESIYRLRGLNRGVDYAPQELKDWSAEYEGTHARCVGEFYDQYHDKFMQVYGPVIQAFRTKDIDDLLAYERASMDLKAGQRVLDAGCGVGVPAIFFAKNAGVRVDAITISKRQYDASLKNIEAEGMMGQINVIQGDYHCLQEYFPQESYDVIYFLESLGHSRSKEHLLNVCWTILKPGGLLYIKDLFKRIPILEKHKATIDGEVRKINEAYRYDISDLNTVLNHIRGRGYILSLLKTVDLNLSDFENLSISNDFQELTGIARIEDWDQYIFPVEFFEIKCIKPDYDVHERPDRYFLQNLFWKQATKQS